MTIKKCLECEKETTNSKFCSTSCAATYNNKRRLPRTEESLEKTRNSLKKLSPWKNISKEKRKEWSIKGNSARDLGRKQKFDLNVETADWENLTNKEKRERVFREQKGRCFECGIEPIWNGKVLKFQLDHISGDKTDNSRQNNRLLCPNCHTQTDTYCVGNNKNPGNIQYSDEQIISALKQNESAYKAMKALGMNPHGGNYVRLRKIVKVNMVELPYSF